MTVHQTNDHPAAPQGNQCLFSHFLASLGAKEIAHNCTSMLWSIDSCENRVSADQYHMTVPRAQVSTHWGRVFFEVFCWQITSFKWSQAQFYFFQWFIWNILCLCHYGPALLRFWFQTDLGRENSASFLKIQAGKTFSYHGHALVTLYVQFLCSDWSKFDRWVHAENLCSILKLVYFDSWSWQSFVSTCDVFNCLFLLNVQKWNTAAIKSLLLFMAGLFIGFLVEKCIACQNSVIRFPTASFSFFTLLNA